MLPQHHAAAPVALVEVRVDAAQAGGGPGTTNGPDPDRAALCGHHRRCGWPVRQRVEGVPVGLAVTEHDAPRWRPARGRSWRRRRMRRTSRATSVAHRPTPRAGPDRVERHRRLGARGQAARRVAAVLREGRAAAPWAGGPPVSTTEERAPPPPCDHDGPRAAECRNDVVEAAQVRPGRGGVGQQRRAGRAPPGGCGRRGG